MGPLEPVPDEPAAIAAVGGGQRALVIADYHAGIEGAFRSKGVQAEPRADERREHLLGLLDDTEPDRVVFLGDLAHRIGRPAGRELAELEALVEAVTDRVPAVLVKGNHDGEFEAALDLPVTDSAGVVLGDVGFVHGHSWPAPAVLEADVVCVGHEHPAVRIEDQVGGGRVERVWLRGDLAPAAFDREGVDPAAIDGELVVFPAFNELAGSTWINVEGQSFLAPFLPAGLAGGEAYLLDGTRLGPYRDV
ncbi:MAG: metallophosphoesterase family protein [Halobacteriales archaeon]|nr:metallophosphoesterase family protein [Halobacteriales archaeon]